MNVNMEPALLLQDFCKATGRGTSTAHRVFVGHFDDETDVQPFLDWMLFNDWSRWSYLKEYHQCTDIELIRVGLEDWAVAS